MKITKYQMSNVTLVFCALTILSPQYLTTYIFGTMMVICLSIFLTMKEN